MSLAFSRQRDESIFIGEEIKITVLNVRGDKATIGVTAPPEMLVHRAEVYNAIKQTNETAAQARAERKQREGSPANFKIRLATVLDMLTINEIYNHYVQSSTCTYQETSEPMESRQKWFAKHGVKHPVTVALLDGQIVGWGSLSPYHSRSAYRHSVEDSIYVHHEFHRMGIGSLILKDLIDRARTIGHRTIIAGVDAEQKASLGLHDQFGFMQVGRLTNVGFKFNRWLDVIYFQLTI